MTQYGFYFDSSRCTGCKTCELACKDYKDLGTDILFRRVYDYEGGDWTQGADGTWTSTCFAYHVSDACNHCEAPACLPVCPAGAITKDEATGFVYNDTELCIGCGSCVMACPYDAPRIDAEKNVARRCDGCLDRVREDKVPICVEACPLRALEFDTIDALRNIYGSNADLLPLPLASQTVPSIVIQVPPAANSPAIGKGFIANAQEV